MFPAGYFAPRYNAVRFFPYTDLVGGGAFPGYFFKRNTKLYISKGTKSTTTTDNTVQLSVKDFSFNRQSSMVEVGRNTLDVSQDRGIKPFVSVISPVTFTFTTYITPLTLGNQKLLISDDISDGWTLDQVTADINTATNKYGLFTMDRINVSTTAGSYVHYIYKSTTSTADVQYTLSAYFRNDGADYAWLNAYTSTGNWITVVYDLVNGVVSSSGTGSTSGSIFNSEIKDLGGGLFHCLVKFSVGENNAIIGIGTSDTATPSYSSGGKIAYQGVEDEDIFVGDISLEIGEVTSPEENLWLSLMGSDTVSNTPFTSTIDFADGNVGELQNLTIWFNNLIRQENNFRLDNAVVDRAIIDFDINGIGEIRWEGRAVEIVEDNGGPSNFTDRSQVSSCIKNKLSTISIDLRNTTYNLGLIGGSIIIDNKNTFYGRTKLGETTVPQGHYTGNRKISGDLNFYMKTGDNTSSDLYNAILSNIDNKDYESVFLANIIINIGGLINSNLQFEIPQAIFGIGRLDFNEVISTSIPFIAKEETGNYSSVIYNI
jgi:hypothetical protein